MKDGGYAFLKRTDLMLSTSLWKGFQLLQILKDLSTKHLIKLIWYENNRFISICDMFEGWYFDSWYLKWIHQEKRLNGWFVFLF